MPVELLAFAEDGLVFFRQNGEVFFCRGAQEPERSTDGAVARAVGDHGFEALSEVFASIEEMLDFVRRKASRPDATRVAEGLLRIAPVETLIRFLDRVEHELLPNRAYLQAIALLEGMLTHAPRLKNAPELERRALALLERARNPV